MLTVVDVKEWLDCLPELATVYVDEDGICLRCVERPLAYLELGGYADEDTQDA